MDHPLVVGEVERRRLDPAVGVAGREDDVDDADWRERTQLWVAKLGIDREVVLEVLQIRAESLELCRLIVVADRDERLECGFVVEPLVLARMLR